VCVCPGEAYAFVAAVVLVCLQTWFIMVVVDV